MNKFFINVEKNLTNQIRIQNVPKEKSTNNPIYLPHISDLLVKIINKCVSDGVIPDDMKIAIKTPMPNRSIRISLKTTVPF